VESIKAASDVYTALSGTVAEVNEALTEHPEKINEAPYDNWIAAIDIADESELDALMDAAAYRKFCEGLE
jgi:glycine cleavage system H protein